eukprot:m51a1_g4277 putative C-tail anchored protein (295) ;mRNA; f:331936-333151
MRALWVALCACALAAAFRVPDTPAAESRDPVSLFTGLTQADVAVALGSLSLARAALGPRAPAVAAAAAAGAAAGDAAGAAEASGSSSEDEAPTGLRCEARKPMRCSAELLSPAARAGEPGGFDAVSCDVANASEVRVEYRIGCTFAASGENVTGSSDQWLLSLKYFDFGSLTNDQHRNEVALSAAQVAGTEAVVFRMPVAGVAAKYHPGGRFYAELFFSDSAANAPGACAGLVMHRLYLEERVPTGHTQFRLSSGAIAGIVIACVVATAAVAGCVYYAVAAKRKRARAKALKCQ